MVFSYYLRKYPYHLLWKYLHHKSPRTVFYCADYLDYIVFQPIQKHLPPLPIYAKNDATLKQLALNNLTAFTGLTFPQAVIMCRHATHYFPEPNMVKIGMKHGVHHFKKLTSVDHFKQFSLYLTCSQSEVNQLNDMGVNNIVAVGYPKLDPAFDGTITKQDLLHLQNNCKLHKSKPTLLFTATWDKSGMSAIAQWISYLPELSHDYNILVTVHPWTSQHYITLLRNMKSVTFINTPETLPFLMLADVIIGDTSSILGEACALNKPIITFKVERTGRTAEDTMRLLNSFSLSISHTSELPAAIRKCLLTPNDLFQERANANRIMFDQLDGKAGQRAAKIIQQKINDTIK